MSHSAARPQPKKDPTTELTETTDKRLPVFFSVVSVSSVVDLFLAAQQDPSN
jgi:hypothetical protein